MVELDACSRGCCLVGLCQRKVERVFFHIVVVVSVFLMNTFSIEESICTNYEKKYQGRVSNVEKRMKIKYRYKKYGV